MVYVQLNVDKWKNEVVQIPNQNMVVLIVLEKEHVLFIAENRVKYIQKYILLYVNIRN